MSFHEAFLDHGGKLCVVTELVAGGDLGRLIRRRAHERMRFTEEQVSTRPIHSASATNEQLCMSQARA